MYKVIDQSQDEYMKKMWIMYIKKIIINYLFFPYCQLVNLYNEIDIDLVNGFFTLSLPNQNNKIDKH